MNQTLYVVALALVALAVLINRGNRNRVHQAIQLYLMQQFPFWRTGGQPGHIGNYCT